MGNYLLAKPCDSRIEARINATMWLSSCMLQRHCTHNVCWSPCMVSSGVKQWWHLSHPGPAMHPDQTRMRRVFCCTTEKSGYPPHRCWLRTPIRIPLSCWDPLIRKSDRVPLASAFHSTHYFIPLYGSWNIYWSVGRRSFHLTTLLRERDCVSPCFYIVPVVPFPSCRQPWSSEAPWLGLVAVWY